MTWAWLEKVKVANTKDRSWLDKNWYSHTKHMVETTKKKAWLEKYKTYGAKHQERGMVGQKLCPAMQIICCQGTTR